MSHAAASPARRSALKALLSAGRAAPKFNRSQDEMEMPRGLEPRERALAERLIKGVLRRKTLLDALLRQAAASTGARFDACKTPEANLWVLRLAAFEKVFQGGAPDYAIGAQAVALARGVGGEAAARFTNALVRKLLPALPEDAAALEAAAWFQALPPAERLAIPGEIIAEYQKAYGAAAAEGLQSLAQADAATWLRVNTLKGSAEGVRAKLIEAGCETEFALGGRAALRWSGGVAPWTTAAWDAGELVVQDLAAQLAAELLAPQPGETVADLCAAPGGKTGHLWELMAGRERLIAWEVDAPRRVVLRENLERLHGAAAGIELREEGSAAELVRALGEQSCDAVLIDAPCQALGLIRRHPEIRWDGRLAAQGEMQQAQRALLAAAAKLVRPGGRLLWVTCSPTLAENEGVAGAFVGEQPGWRAAELAVPGELAEAVVRHGGTLRTRPERLDWDAFAYTLLVRDGV